jgi:hypothetical protein
VRTPESYRIAFAALDALYTEVPTDYLAVLLGSMQINKSDDLPMDSGALADWEQAINRAKNQSDLDQLLAYLRLLSSRYDSAPNDLRNIIDALERKGTKERRIVESVITLRRNQRSTSP